MKNILFCLGLGLFAMVSCNSDGSENLNDTTQTMSQTNNENRSLTDTMGATQITPSEFAKGKELINQSDCLGCHKDYEKLIGPSYSEIAAKYENNEKNVAYLVGKIKEGGSGVWGEVPMTPHPALSDEDAGEMAKYVLSLR